VLFFVLAVFAPLLASYDPAAIDLMHRLAAPSHTHWFGTDELGRDIYSRIVYGARISLEVAVSVVALSLGTGLVLGGLAGYYGGAVDTVLNVFVMNAFMALPGILLVS
jgi:peptide/nickel transport system permease protein